MFSFRAREDYRYSIRVRHGSISDTVLVLYDADGDYVIDVIEDDDSGGDGAARLDWVAQRSGTYYVEVKGYDGGESGSYRLELEFSAPAAPVAQPTIAPAPAPAAMTSDITITMAIREVAEQFGDFEVQTYGGSPAETQMGFYRSSV